MSCFYASLIQNRLLAGGKQSLRRLYGGIQLLGLWRSFIMCQFHELSNCVEYNKYSFLTCEEDVKPATKMICYAFLFTTIQSAKQRQRPGAVDSVSVRMLFRM
ncbi:unnamed protein product [Citrullus colocynthis]|uniref:Uncharacterized protein n=1 Tax=Citrullus colocynthis TaxID=252529 RepID=A0ABP0XZP3_9ROSI